MKDKKSLITIASILLIIFISGCISGTLNLQNLYITEEKKEEISDILTIENVETVPKPPIFSGDSFLFYFVIKNKDNIKTIKNVKVILFDPSVFKVSSEADKCSESSPCSLMPLDQKIISFNLTAPKKEEIGNVEINPKVSFRVLYTLEGSTYYDVIGINLDELAKYQQAGKSLSLTRNKVITSGPIKIDAELINAEAVISGKTGKLRFVIRNTGTGSLLNNEIGKNDLKIDFAGLEVSHDMEDVFSCSSSVCTNKEEIKLIGKESPPLLFTIKMPSNIEIWKTFTINAKINYTYEARGSKEISVIPAE